MDKHFDLELTELRTTKENLDGLAKTSQEASSMMHLNTVEGANKTMDPQMYGIMREMIQQLYQEISGDKSADKMQNSTPLQLLEYVENSLDMQLEKFHLYEKIDADITNKKAKAIQTTKRF